MERTVAGHGTEIKEFFEALKGIIVEPHESPKRTGASGLVKYRAYCYISIMRNPSRLDKRRKRYGVVSGIDLVRIEEVRSSLDSFGQRYVSRIFTRREAAYADAAPVVRAERLAARFAAKEACIKILPVGKRRVDWRSIEVLRRADGRCALALRGEARALARGAGLAGWSVSLTHEGDYAAAVVLALRGWPQARKKA
jgi:holo-[acyl-carrier protein] synthase